MEYFKMVICENCGRLKLFGRCVDVTPCYLKVTHFGGVRGNTICKGFIDVMGTMLPLLPLFIINIISSILLGRELITPVGAYPHPYTRV